MRQGVEHHRHRGYEVPRLGGHRGIKTDDLTDPPVVPDEHTHHDPGHALEGVRSENDVPALLGFDHVPHSWHHIGMKWTRRSPATPTRCSTSIERLATKAKPAAVANASASGLMIPSWSHR